MLSHTVRICRIWEVIFSLTAVAFFLSGCGGGGGSGPSPGPSPPPGPPLKPIDCPANFTRGHCTKCYGNGQTIECRACNAPYKLDDANKQTTDACAFDCKDMPNTTTKPGMPTNPTQHNGIAWPDVCFDGASEHFFVIGDWGGMCGGWGPAENNCSRTDLPSWSRPADAEPGLPFTMNNRKGAYYNKVDIWAQRLVRDQMVNKKKDLKSKGKEVRFVVNVGDNFYPGGIESHCSVDNAQQKALASIQFSQIFESMYPVADLGNMEWWSVLGNHDYGGVCYIMGWDQQIYYTWKPNGRWVMPGQFWSRKVQFKTFVVDYWFLDNNMQDAKHPDEDQEHNICSRKHNPGEHCDTKNDFPPSAGQGDADCPASSGPHNPDDCYEWFKARWREQYKWFTTSLKASAAEWQIVVTHYPALYSIGGGDIPSLYWPTVSAEGGIDLIIAGHVHDQEVHYLDEKIPGMNGTAWVVSGGGGGITAEGTIYPITLDGHDDGYGFMDMEISLETIKITSISHGGLQGAYIVRNETTVYPREASTLSSADYPRQDKDELVV